MSFLKLLTIVFIVLKLVEYIDWSWWLVISPLLIEAIIWILVFIVAIITPKRRFRR
jgi:hypothetical protein